MSDIDKNIELGRAEVWRRLKLFFVAVMLSIPLLMVLSAVVSKFVGNPATIGMVLYGALFVILIKLYFWVHDVNCPKCGNKWGGKGTRGLNCVSCGQDFKPDKNSGYSLSFKPIDYDYPGKDQKS